MKDPGKSSGMHFHRRAFLQGSGAVAAATAISGGAAEAATRASRLVRSKTQITLHVNGSDHQVAVEPRDTLLDVLRYQLDLTAAKPVSSDGSSGASTVLVDGKPMTASTLLAVACRGKKIETCESVSSHHPDRICRTFVKHDSLQCGFCTPGFVVAVRAFLKRHPHATREQIRQGLNGNLCRCGTYADMIEAVVDLVKGGGNG